MKKILILMLVTGMMCSCSDPVSNLFGKADSGAEVSTDEKVEVETDVETPADEKEEKVTEEKQEEKQEEKKEELVELKSSDESAADGMTVLEKYESFILSEDDTDTIKVCTGAEVSDGEIMWDDGNEYVIELETADGKYYTFFEGRVQLGSVYYKHLDINEKEYILINMISTASDSTTAFLLEDGKVYEVKNFDTNILNDADINMKHSSVPGYGYEE